MLTVDELTDRNSGELCDLVEWWDCFHANPGVIFTKKQRFLMTYQVAYRDTDQMSHDERAWYLSQLDEAVRLLPEGWAVDSDLWHEPTTAYPTVGWDALGGSPVDKLVDSLRHADFLEHPRMHSSLLLTLSWDPPSRARQWLRELVLTRAEDRRHRRNLDEDLGLFLEGGDLFTRALRPVLDAAIPLDAPALCTYLHQCVSWDRQPLQCPLDHTDLDWQLTNTLWVPGQPGTLGDQYVQTLTIKTWTPALRTYVPEALSKLPFPLRYHVRWVPKSLTTAEALLSAAERKWASLYKGVKGMMRSATGGVDDSEVAGRSSQDLAIQAGASIVAMRRDVRQGHRVAGQLKPTVVLWAPDRETLDARVKEVHEVLLHQGLVARQEKAGNSIEWLASLPGHRDYGIRHRLLATEECTAVMPHCAQWVGASEEPFLGGPPWLMATSDGAPFGVAMHTADELGSAMVMGPTRKGKSGLLGLLTSQGFKYPRMRACLFDLDYSLYCLTLMRGGAHYALGAPGSPAIQLLGTMETEADQTWAALQLENILTGEGLAPDPEERRDILGTVRLMSDPDVPVAMRTMSLARTLLPHNRLKVGLTPFCQGGEYAFCDGATDRVAWEQRLVCFEMAALRKHPRALNPVLSWCFHQLESRWFTGDPVRIVVDEARWLLGIPWMLSQMEEWLKTRAKLKVALWISTQEMEDLHKVGIWQAAVASMPIRILLPNPAAMSEKVLPLYEQLDLPPHALRRLVSAQAYRDYLYCSPLGHRLFQCAMSKPERLLCAASSKEEITLLHLYRQEYSPEELPVRWLQHFGCAEEARLLATHLQEEDPVCAVQSLLSVPLPWERSSSLSRVS